MKKKAPKTAKSAKTSKPGLPASRFAAEQVLRDVQRAIAGKDFASIEGLNAYLAALAGPGLQQSLRDIAPLSPREEAQELAYAAMEAKTKERARTLARRALAKDPDCVDALVVMTGIEAESPEQAIAGLQKALTAGERSLGAKFFKENKGHFWGLMETRSYMRARVELAELLHREGLNLEAIQHYEALLELNPGDNQGVRYPLLGLYLLVGNLEGARKLLREFEDDAMATFAWGRALERVLSGDLPGASVALGIARKENRFFELYLTGQKDMPNQWPDSYSLGSEEEAIMCLDNIGLAWVEHPGAALWLVHQFFAEEAPRKKAVLSMPKKVRHDP
ncbi:MAG: tetratricopeptide repeat protein [Acidobacteriaceae bacterium]